MRGIPLLCSLLIFSAGCAASPAATPAERPSAERPSAGPPAETARRAAAQTGLIKITDLTPRPGEKVGVGMPIIVRFNHPVPDKKAVERVLSVSSTKSTVGAWHWTKNAQGRQLAIFRPKRWWPADQKVVFEARLKGVKAGKNLVGGADARLSFKIGDEHVVKASARTHVAKAYRDGELVREWNVSMGAGGNRRADGVDYWQTASGIHLVMDHKRRERMRSGPQDKEDWDVWVDYATRISASGEYIHESNGQLWCLGRQNCSHGCVRSSRSDAAWFFRWSYRGDPVVITGTERKLPWDNGWSYHQMPWKRWLAGSALKTPVVTS
ncbi:L,D-transpeptidase [Actinocorallia sp. B10E7]|uniref:L,D-transpeptidase n=1 Tax=Actinocorallia sp. B10E7 TaxID=3153558 RepID=UPI00325D25C3